MFFTTSENVNITKILIIKLSPSSVIFHICIICNYNIVIGNKFSLEWVNNKKKYVVLKLFVGTFRLPLPTLYYLHKLLHFSLYLWIFNIIINSYHLVAI